MYKCENGHRFEFPNNIKQSSEYWGTKTYETMWSCPECNSTSVSEAREWDTILEELYDDFNTLIEQIEEYKVSKHTDFREFIEETYD